MRERFVPEDFRGRPACVLGLGRSGLACANLLSAHGFDVLVSESRASSPALQEEAKKLRLGVRWEFGGHSKWLRKAGFWIKSPGIPSHAPILEEARRLGIPVFSELEAALAFAPPVRLYAVTGTNGKTTVTRLLGDILSAAGRRVQMAGNIGTPISGVVPSLSVGDDLVLEVSSYQLEDSAYFKPSAACLTNLTPDHLDHHGGFEAYAEAKARIFRSQTARDVCVFYAGDDHVQALSELCPSRRLYYAMRRSDGLQAYRTGGKLHIQLDGSTHRLVPPRLPGDHNLQNAMAAALMALSQGIPAGAVQRAFDGFVGVEHRLEDVAEVARIRCVNDSKATNVDSTLIALLAYPKARGNILLILGGLDKGAPYGPLKAEIETKVRVLLTIGQAAGKIARELEGAAPIVPCGTLEHAVAEALRLGRPGDLLLLSPACASFDQFKDFEDRGRAFKEIVRSFPGSKSQVPR